MPGNSDTARATSRVRRWHIATQVARWVLMLGTPVVMAVLRFAFHMPTGPVAWLTAGALLGTTYGACHLCRWRLGLALEAHPLRFLIRLQEEFGSVRTHNKNGAV